jgi:hypothetical protein
MRELMLKRVLFPAIIFVLLIGGMGCLESSVPSATATEVENGIFQQVNAERVEYGKDALTRNTSLDALAREYATSKFAETTSYSTKLVYMACNIWQLNFSGSPSLTTDTAADQVEYCVSQTSMRDAMLTNEAVETGVGVVAVGSNVYFAQVFDVVRSSGADGNPIILDENPDATDPTWAALEAFLVADLTNNIEYDDDLFICGDYAEALHNNAEDTGIKAAYVSVRLNQEPGHALNAFNVDGTTVFIDVGAGDKVAYMEIGESYGVIKLDAAEQFTYAYFETYVEDFEAYETDLADYNAQVIAYNDHEDPPAPYTTEQEWADALDVLLVELNAEKIRLGLDGAYFHPTESLDTPDPTVVDYYVHW